MMGIRIIKVPQLVPEANAKKTEIRKMMTGRNICREAAEASTTSWMKGAAPSRPVMPDRFQERMRMIMGAHMVRKPAGMPPMKVLKSSTPRIR